MNEATRKDRILSVAERLFRHYGPQKTTMADIAREAQVGVGSVYLDFDSKEAILDELSRRRRLTVARMMESAAEGAGPSERLRRMLEARVAALLILAGEGAHACDLVHCHSSQPASFDEEARRLMLVEIEAGVRAGEFSCEPLPTVRAIEVAFAALSPPHLFRFERHDATDLARRLSLLVVHGLRGPEVRGLDPGAAASRGRGALGTGAPGSGAPGSRSAEGPAVELAVAQVPRARNARPRRA